MPEISRFYGIVIKMFFDDHNPPHFHAEYAEHSAVFAIESLALMRRRDICGDDEGRVVGIEMLYLSKRAPGTELRRLLFESVPQAS